MADALQHDQSPMVRVTMAFSLGRIGQESALGPLKNAAETDPEPAVRNAASEASGMIGPR